MRPGYERLRGFLDRPERDEAVEDDADEDAGYGLVEAVAEEAAERAGRELLRDELERDDRDRERHTGDGRDGGRDRRENAARRGRPGREKPYDAALAAGPIDLRQESGSATSVTAISPGRKR